MIDLDYILPKIKGESEKTLYFETSGFIIHLGVTFGIVAEILGKYAQSNEYIIEGRIINRCKDCEGQVLNKNLNMLGMQDISKLLGEMYWILKCYQENGKI